MLAHLEPERRTLGTRCKVYRNLHRGGYSIKRGAHVVSHQDTVVLLDATFTVGEAGRQRVLREKKKNVHAFVSGLVSSFSDTQADDIIKDGVRVSYNPYKAGHFIDVTTGEPIHYAFVVAITTRGMYAIL